MARTSSKRRLASGWVYNGLYQLRLEATDVNGQTSATTVNVQVQGGMKIGVFTLSFVDLQIPVSGIPITVTRTYDSRVKSQRDFGIGWSLDVAAGRYHHNRRPGEGWTLEDPPGLFTLPCSQTNELTNHRTEVRLSDREWYSFAATVVDAAPTVGGCSAQMGFEQIGGYAPGATLELLSNPYVFQEVNGDELFDDETFNVWNPSTVRLTTYDGRAIEFERGVGITAIEDLNGNRIEIGEGGISSSTGKSITFTRDPEGRIVEIEDPMEHVLTYQYDANGDLARFTNQLGNITDFFYDDAHNLEDIIDPLGVRAVRNEYDNDGRLVATIDPRGNRFTFEHDLDARRETLTNRLGYTRFNDYDERGNIVLETYPGSPPVTKARTYDARDNVLTETNEEEETTVWTYDSRNNVLTETNAMDETQSWTYSNLGRVLTHTDGRGEVMSYTYDSAGRELTMTDREGFVSRNVYNSRGDLIRTCDPRGYCTSMSYNSFGHQTRKANKRAHTTYYTYDANGRMLTATSTRSVGGVGQTLVTTYTRDALGREVQSIGPDGAIRQTVFDARGQVMRAVDPLGRVTEFERIDATHQSFTHVPDGVTMAETFDEEDRLVARTDVDGRVWTFEYDDRGRQIRSEVDGAANEYAFDASNRPVERRDRLGNPALIVFDDAGRAIETRNALNQATVKSYDEGGNLASLTDAKSRVTTFTYDARALRTRVDYPDSTFITASYDQDGNMLSQTDQEGRSTTFTYDGEGNLTSVTNAEDETWAFAYDEQNNLISQTDPLSRVVTFTYDLVGRETSRKFAGGPTQSLAYDLAGNLTSQTSYSGAVTTYGYDSKDQIVTKDPPDATATSLTYTPSGQRETVADPRGVTRFVYDSSERLSGIIEPSGRSLSFAYDAEGNRTGLVADTGLDLWSETYSYDVLNRVTGLSADGLSFSLTYDATGQVSTVTYPNGLVTTFTYDQLDRVASITTRSGATVVRSLVYDRNDAGDVSSILEQDGRLTEFGYDDAKRLTSEHVTVSSVEESLRTYSYDDAGNRTQRTYTPSGGSIQTENSTFDSRDRILTQGSISFTSDTDGRTVSRSGSASYSMTWDAQDRLIDLEHADGSTSHLEYDADGVLVREALEAVGGSEDTTDLLVDTSLPLSQVVAELDASTGETTARYIRIGGLLLGVIRPSGTRYFHGDHLGSTRWLSNESGTITDSYRYTAWGELTSHSGSDSNRYLFAGEPFDPSLRLSYNRARWFEPNTARLLSIDPIDGNPMQPSGLGRYSYAQNNPVGLLDPSGMLSTGEMMTTVSVLSTTVRIAALGVAVGAGIGPLGGPGADRDHAEEAANRLAVCIGQDPRSCSKVNRARFAIFFPGSNHNEHTRHIWDSMIGNGMTFESDLMPSRTSVALHWEPGETQHKGKRKWYRGAEVQAHLRKLGAIRPADSHWDEYPFYATREGGATNWVLHRVSLRGVDGTENMSAGSWMRHGFIGPCGVSRDDVIAVVPQLVAPTMGRCPDGRWVMSP